MLQRAEECHEEGHGEIAEEAVGNGEWHIGGSRSSCDDGQGGVGGGCTSGSYWRKRIHISCKQRSHQQGKDFEIGRASCRERV